MPVNTATDASASASNAKNASNSFRAVAPSTALRQCGRLMETTVTGPSRSTSTVSASVMSLGLPDVFLGGSFASEVMLKQELGPSQSPDLPDGQITDLLSSPACKNILVFIRPKSLLELRHPVPHRGAFRDRHGRRVRDAVDAAASGAPMACWTNDADADGEVVWS